MLYNLARGPLGLLYCKIDSLNQTLPSIIKIIMIANEPKNYITNLAGHSSTASGFSRDNPSTHVRESICANYQNFTVNPAAVAMAHGESSGLWVYRQVKTVVRTHWMVIDFSPEVNFDHFLSVLSRNSEAWFPLHGKRHDHDTKTNLLRLNGHPSH